MLQAHVVFKAYCAALTAAKGVKTTEAGVYAVGDLKVFNGSFTVRSLTGDSLNTLHKLSERVDIVAVCYRLLPVGRYAYLGELYTFEFQQLADAAHMAVGFGHGYEICLRGNRVQTELQVSGH